MLDVRTVGTLGGISSWKGHREPLGDGNIPAHNWGIVTPVYPPCEESLSCIPGFVFFSDFDYTSTNVYNTCKKQMDWFFIFSKKNMHFRKRHLPNQLQLQFVETQTVREEELSFHAWDQWTSQGPLPPAPGELWDQELPHPIPHMGRELLWYCRHSGVLSITGDVSLGCGHKHRGIWKMHYSCTAV